MSIVITKSKGIPKRLQGLGAVGDVASDAADLARRGGALFQTEVAPFIQRVQQATSQPAPTPTAIMTEPSKTVQLVQRTSATFAVLSLPFFAYLAFSPRLPGWARLFAAGLGVGALTSQGGLIQTWAARDAGAPQEAVFQGYRGLTNGPGGCGCGCDGGPGDCQCGG